MTAERHRGPCLPSRTNPQLAHCPACRCSIHLGSGYHCHTSQSSRPTAQRQMRKRCRSEVCRPVYSTVLPPLQPRGQWIGWHSSCRRLGYYQELLDRTRIGSEHHCHMSPSSRPTAQRRMHKICRLAASKPVWSRVQLGRHSWLKRPHSRFGRLLCSSPVHSITRLPGFINEQKSGSSRALTRFNVYRTCLESTSTCHRAPTPLPSGVRVGDAGRQRACLCGRRGCCCAACCDLQQQETQVKRRNPHWNFFNRPHQAVPAD